MDEDWYDQVMTVDWLDKYLEEVLAVNWLEGYL